jgi:hypothetical protein
LKKKAKSRAIGSGYFAGLSPADRNQARRPHKSAMLLHKAIGIAGP